jgi:hypothetical protein
MTAHIATPTQKAVSGFLAAAVAACGFAAAALTPTPTANATCASFSGINFGSGCKSTVGGMAIAIGTGATATANGFFSTAIAVGTNISALVSGVFNLGVAAGTGSQVISGNTNGSDIGNIAVSFGDGNNVEAGATSGNGFGNIASSLGNGNFVFAIGALDMASNLGNDSEIEAEGIANNASNFGGNDNVAVAVNTNGSAGFNRAFLMFSNHSVAAANPGPFALAGSIFQTNATVTKESAGFNINGVKVGGAAAPAQQAATALSTKTTVKSAAHTGNKAHSATATRKHVS